MEEIRYLGIFVSCSKAFSKSKKFSVCFFPPSSLLPKSPKLMPVNTISFTPLLASACASVTTFSMRSLLLFPRAIGMVQKVQL